MILVVLFGLVLSGQSTALKCGKPVITPYETNIYDRIVGGRVARPNSWPWQARLGSTLSFTGTMSQYCGATIIHARWLLTAAHCIIPGAKDTFVRVGLHNQDVPESEEPKSKTYYIKRIVVHPDYHLPPLIDHDLALLEMFHPIQFTNEISPICLPSDGFEPTAGQECIATGWGYPKRPTQTVTFSTDFERRQDVASDANPLTSNVLKQVVLNIVDRNVCNSSQHYNCTVYHTHICAGRLRQGLCTSDSGGPLVCKNHLGAFELSGVTSWGIGCADDRYPVLFAHVAMYLPWIRNITGM